VSLFKDAVRQNSATERHLPCGIMQCYLPADTGGGVPPYAQPTGQVVYSIYLPRRDGRLSWPWWLVIYTKMVYLPTDRHPSQ